MRSLQEMHVFLTELQWLDSTEVIVVTADADDGTPSIVAEQIKQFPLHRHIMPGPRVGKGRDVKCGMEAATAPVMVFTDADLATPLHHMIEAFRVLEEGAGMVIGVRQLNHIHNSFKRRLSSMLANAVVRSVVGWDIVDSQCGFKGFTRDTANILLRRSVVVNWGFDFEFIKIAKLNNISITFQPITDWHDPKAASENLTGDSQLAAMKSTLRELMLVRKNTKKGIYRP